MFTALPSRCVLPPSPQRRWRRPLPRGGERYLAPGCGWEAGSRLTPETPEAAAACYCSSVRLALTLGAGGGRGCASWAGTRRWATGICRSPCCCVGTRRMCGWCAPLCPAAAAAAALESQWPWRAFTRGGEADAFSDHARCDQLIAKARVHESGRVGRSPTEQSPRRGRLHRAVLQHTLTRQTNRRSADGENRAAGGRRVRVQVRGV